MEPWRGRARGLFPELSAELAEDAYGIYQLFFDLLPMAREAHVHDDDGLLRRVYGFATWCLSQDDKGLWNPAGVAFFEHVFDDWSQRSKVIPWLSPAVVRDCSGLWEARLRPEQYTELGEALERRKDGM